MSPGRGCFSQAVFGDPMLGAHGESAGGGGASRRGLRPKKRHATLPCFGGESGDGMRRGRNGLLGSESQELPPPRRRPRQFGCFLLGSSGVATWSELLAEVSDVGGEGGTGMGLRSPPSQGDARWQPSTLAGLEEGEMLREEPTPLSPARTTGGPIGQQAPKPSAVAQKKTNPSQICSSQSAPLGIRRGVQARLVGAVDKGTRSLLRAVLRWGSPGVFSPGLRTEMPDPAGSLSRTFSFGKRRVFGG